MGIFENIGHIHTAFIFILVSILLIYINAQFFSRFRKTKSAVIEFFFFFALTYKCILYWQMGENYSRFYGLSSAFVIISLSLASLLFIYGVFIGFREIKYDAIAEIKKVKYLFFGAAVAILTAPFIYSLPSHSYYQPERSFYSAGLLIIFLLTILGISPLFYAMQKAISLKEKTHETLTQRILALSFYYACLISNILVLSLITLSFSLFTLMAFAGGQP